MSSSLLYIYPFPFFSSSDSSSGDNGSFPYHEPGVVELLILLSFIFLLNVVRVVADYYLYGGIIAEIALGMVYGEPLAAILPVDWEGTFTVLGYLGLIGIVFEGGLSTDLGLLVANLPLSVLCASIGIALPVAFSFALLFGGYGYRPLEAFAAGAALCSTSLGTTLMALNSVTSSLGSSSGVTTAETVVCQEKEERAAGPSSDASVEDALTPDRITPTPDLQPPQESPALQKSRIGTVLISAAVIDDVIGLVLSSLVPALSALEDAQSHMNLAWQVVRPMLASALMAAVTPLVARYILRPLFRYRGLGHRWCTPRRPGSLWGSPALLRLVSRPGSDLAQWGTQGHADAVGVIIMVLFVSAFATIAFYTGSSVLFGAYLAGLTITYLQHAPKKRQDDATTHLSFEETYARTIGPLQQAVLAPLFFASIGYGIPFLQLWRPAVLWRGILYALLMAAGKLAVGLPVMLWALGAGGAGSAAVRLRKSLLPALFIGVAMVARGEIGLLIAQIARSPPGGADGLLDDEAFLVCIWAILLCTLFSPIGVGFLVNRWKDRIIHGM